PSQPAAVKDELVRPPWTQRRRRRKVRQRCSVARPCAGQGEMRVIAPSLGLEARQPALRLDPGRQVSDGDVPAAEPDPHHPGQPASLEGPQLAELEVENGQTRGVERAGDLLRDSKLDLAEETD